MRIVIAGAGAVGTHLAKLLSGENENVVLMDEDEERLSKMESSLDLLTVVGSATRIKSLKECSMDDADLFVAVTPHESQNIHACLLAHSLGAKKTVARIDNYEYLQQKNKDFFMGLGINSLIYPEYLAAQEICSSIRYSWIRQLWEFCDGALVMVGVKVRNGAQILNTPLKNLGGVELPYHVVAIQRGNETIIPRGDDLLLHGDLVCFMTTKGYIPYIRRICGKEDYDEVKNVIIMGGSRIAIRTALMIPDNIQIKIIEPNLDKCQKLTEFLGSRVMIINGDGRDLDLLASEGIKSTESFVALTDNSETNILACLAAKRFGVSKTVAEVENIDYISMAESMDIGTVINKKKIAASNIFQMMLNTDVSSVKCLTFSDAEVVEFPVKEGARITRHPVKDIGLPHGATIGGLVRNKEGIRVTGNTIIQPGDHVIVFCLEMMIKKLEKFFS